MVYVNDDWESAGVRTVNACPQPGVAEAELPDDHESLRDITGYVPPEEQADRDMNSSLAQTIFSELNTPGPDRARVRQALIDSHARGRNAARIRNRLPA